MRALTMLGVAAALLAIAPAHAETCASPAPPPAELVGWARQTPLAGGTRADKAAPLALGAAAKVALRPAAELRYALAPKPQDAGGNGAILTFAIPSPGAYRIALGSRGWIELLQDGKPIASTTHAHGGPCTGIAKMVDFALVSGSYVLQIEGVAEPATAVMVARLP